MRLPDVASCIGLQQGLPGAEQVGGVRAVREGGAAARSAAREPQPRAAQVGLPAHGHYQSNQGSLLPLAPLAASSSPEQSTRPLSCSEGPVTRICMRFDTMYTSAAHSVTIVRRGLLAPALHRKLVRSSHAPPDR